MPDVVSFWDLPHGSTTFCDDIRHEMGGKLSYMGIYKADLVAPHFPANIDLSFAISYGDKGLSDIKNLIFKIVLEREPGAEEVLLEVSMTPTGEGPFPPSDNDEGTSTIPTMALMGKIRIENLNKPGRLKSRVYRDEEEIRLGSLKLLAAPSAAEQTPA